ncbi:phospholipase C, phosphocholine-specific [Granulicella sp. dw_53]|uniref:phosphocholine-specific phospholipase C n=1 Tax=Granulicella sp. dw_53 TaxID=2719792 RepID=UPI001BD3DDCE|nr:phospholipase C, phosphocholine-specific [Granulicella sp. dw_53]
MQTRRDFLKKAAMLSGLAGASGIIPESVQRAFAIAPAPDSTYLDAEHIVIMMQENRSFDHTLGTLRGVRGFNDPRAIRQANGNSIFLQTSMAGETYAPFRLDIKDTKATWMGSIPHSRHTQVDAWNYGNHNGWIDAKRPHNAEYAHVPLTMGHYTREDLPFHYALADAFTVCDQHYCGAMTSTTPNRSIFMTGTVRDQQSVDSKVFMRNDQLAVGGMTWKTFPERLQEAGIDWKFYQNELTHSAGMSPEEHKWLSNFGCNVLEMFGAYHKETANSDLQKRAFVTNVADKDYRSLDMLHFENDGKKIQMKVPKGDVLHQFRHDVDNGKLPTVSWLAPPEKFSDHPTSPWFGGWWVSEIVDILTKNPEVWKKTIFIYTYDENDGYFDHAPSFVATDPKNRATGRASAGIDTGLEYTYVQDELRQGVAPQEARSGPIGLGYRVPLIIASPWTRGGWVNSQLFEHSSTLQFLETFIGQKYGKQVHEANISPWRRTVSGDLTSAFRPYSGEKAELPFLERDKFLETIQLAKDKELPSNFKNLSREEISQVNADPRRSPLLSKQEKGIRPSNALPYELYADGVATDNSFELHLTAANTVHGAKSAGSPFNVYLRNVHMESGAKKYAGDTSNMLAATYTVKAGDILRQAFPMALFADGRYDIDVVAPNGFYRSFRGVSTPNSLMVHTTYESKGFSLTGNIEVKLRNTTKAPITVEVSDNSYKTSKKTVQIAAATEMSVVLDLSKQYGWYDFTVKQRNSDGESHYAGRVETSRSSYSDPLMGDML